MNGTQSRTLPEIADLRRTTSKAFQRSKQWFQNREILRRAMNETDASNFFLNAAMVRSATPVKRSILRRAESGLPMDPLFDPGNELPPIDITITSHQKDFVWLPLVTKAAVEASTNPIASVRIIAPEGETPILAGLPRDIPLVIQSEVDLLGTGTISHIRQTAPTGRYGWILQQVIKFYAAISTPASGSLIVDADTVLLGKKTWLLSDGKQVLSPSNEFHKPYVEQTESFWGRNGQPHGISFVTHHQLLQKSIVNEMFTDGLVSILTWASKMNAAEQSALSEYHSYGTYLMNSHIESIAWTKWANAIAFNSTPIGVSDASLRAKFPWAQSVSFHSYLNY